MPLHRTTRTAARMAACAALIGGVVALIGPVRTTGVWFHAQDAHLPRALIRSALFGFDGQDGLGDKVPIEITVADRRSGTKRFVGAIGSRDEADFLSQDGSGEVMRVTTLDDRLGALVATRVQGAGPPASGEAVFGPTYSFRRSDGAGGAASGEFRLKWSADGMDSSTAIDVDTYIELHGGTVSQALAELRHSRPIAARK